MVNSSTFATVYLGMSDNNLSMVLDLPCVVNMLPFLEGLQLSYCSLQSFNHLFTHINLTNLEDIDLSHNYFDHLIAVGWFWNLKNINYLNYI